MWNRCSSALWGNSLRGSAMAIRFRKSIKLAPGVRMNLSGSGVGWTLGPRGASVGIGKRGTYLNTGLPGTGLYARQALSGQSGRSAAKPTSSGVPPALGKVSLTVSVSDEGVITFKDQNGEAVSEHLITQAKKQQGDAIKALIQSKCDEINAQVTALGELHHDTPSPNNAPSYRPAPFPVERPVPPVLKIPGLFARMFKGAQIQAENAKAQAQHAAALQQWESALAAFQGAEKKKQELISRAVAGDVDAMERFFGEMLQDIVWPRETLVSFEVRDGGTRLCFDVDLPEVEDMPNKSASAPQRGYKLTVKDIGPIAVQKLYAQHVHSIAFRLIGEAFAMLPTVQEVTLSAFSQRKNKATGHEEEQYLLSTLVSRNRWRELNFSAVASIDVVEALSCFELRRSMTKTGVFSPVQPF